MTERKRLLTSIERLRKVHDDAKKAAREAKEEIEKERKKEETHERVS